MQSTIQVLSGQEEQDRTFANQLFVSEQQNVGQFASFFRFSLEVLLHAEEQYYNLLNTKECITIKEVF